MQTSANVTLGSHNGDGGGAGTSTTQGALDVTCALLKSVSEREKQRIGTSGGCNSLYQASHHRSICHSCVTLYGSEGFNSAIWIMTQDSIASCYRLGFQSGWDQDILPSPNPSRPALGPMQPPLKWTLGFTTRGKVAGSWNWLSTIF